MDGRCFTGSTRERYESRFVQDRMEHGTEMNRGLMDNGTVNGGRLDSGQPVVVRRVVRA